MRQHRFLLALFFSLSPLLLTAQESWQRVPGIPGGMGTYEISSVRYRDRLYVFPLWEGFEFTSNNLYWSSDQGGSWNEVRWSPFAGIGIRAWADSSGALLLMTLDSITTSRHNSLHRSSDGGATWTVIRQFDGSASRESFIVLPDGSYLLGYSKAPAQRSFDQGKTWEDVNLSGGGAELGLLFALRPDGVLYVDQWGSGGSQSYWESYDTGRSWVMRRGTPNAKEYFFVDDSIFFSLETIQSTHVPCTLCRHVNDPGVCVSKTFKTSWRQYGSIVMDRSKNLYFVEKDDNRTRCRIFKSTDRGATWDTLSVTGAFSAFQLQIVDDVLIAFGEHGPLRSFDGGETWVVAHKGINDTALSDPRRAADMTGFFLRSDGRILYVTNVSFVHSYDPQSGSHTLLTVPGNQTLSSRMAESADGHLFAYPISSASSVTIHDLLQLPPGATTFTDVVDPSSSKEEGQAVPLGSSAAGTITSISSYKDDEHDLILIDAWLTIHVYDVQRKEWHSRTPQRFRRDATDFNCDLAISRNGYLYKGYDSSLYRIAVTDLISANYTDAAWSEVLTLPEPFTINAMNPVGDSGFFVVVGETALMTEDDCATWTTVSGIGAPGLDWRMSSRSRICQVTSSQGNGFQRYSILLKNVIDNTLDIMSTTEPYGNGMGQVEESEDGTLYVLIDARKLYRLSIVSGATIAMDESFSSFSLVAAPNPATDRVVVTLQAPAADRCAVRLFDLAGRSVLQSQEIESGGRIVLDVGHLPVGSYRCEVTSLTTGERTSAAVQVVR